MVIIDKVKDYYDYVVGIYGRDEDVIFDRRGSTILATEVLNEFFNKNKMYSDRPKCIEKNKFILFGKDTIDYSKPIGRIFFVLLEIGFMHYMFKLERYLDDTDNNKVCIDVELLEKKRVKKKLSKVAIDYFQAYCRYDNRIQIKNATQSAERNVIMRDTWIPKFIAPEEVWNNIYEYLLSCKDKKIIDSRTDVQKAESHGFNKESFRNPITLKELEKTNKK